MARSRWISNERVLMDRVIKMLPKSVPPEAISSVECDPQDGGPDGFGPSYWIILRPGWMCTESECHTIHEDTLGDLKRMLNQVVPWPDDPELEY